MPQKAKELLNWLGASETKMVHLHSGMGPDRNSSSYIFTLPPTGVHTACFFYRQADEKARAEEIT